MLMSVMIKLLGTFFLTVGALTVAFGDNTDSEPTGWVGSIIAIFGVVLDFIAVGIAFGFI